MTPGAAAVSPILAQRNWCPVYGMAAANGIALSDALKELNVTLAVAFPYWDYMTPSCGTLMVTRWKNCTHGKDMLPLDVPANTVINDKIEGLGVRAC